MKNFKFCLSFVCMLFVLLPLHAKQVDLERAEKVAQRYVQSKQKTQAKTDVRLKFTATKRLLHSTESSLRAQDASTQENSAYYYVFNVNENAGDGFVIVAGDDAVRPVLGYSNHGNYDENHLPPNFAYWMDYLQKQIEYAKEQNLPQSDAIKAEWEAYSTGNISYSTSSAGPLVKTTWSQGAPYWNLCPPSDGQQTVTGCVATAMAQIMKYHNWPTKGSGQSVAYQTKTLKINIPSVDFANTSYDWNNMLPSYSSGATDLQEKAVATLMYHCGVSVQMDYDLGGSNANSYAVPSALTTYFGYDKSVQLRKREFFDDASWEAMLKKQIDAGLPVYYSGNGGSGGHSFVCDGYNGGMFHFNWGWGGYCDDWYVTTALDPGPGGIGAGIGLFNDGQSIIIDIKPDAGGVATYEMGLYNKFSTGLTSALPGTNFTVSANFQNIGQAAFPGGSYEIALVDGNDRIVEIAGIFNYLYELPPGYSWQSPFNINCTVPNVATGNYKLRAVTKSTSETDGKIITLSSGCPNSIDFYVGSSSVVPVTGVTLNKSSLTLDIGGSDQLTGTIVPANATDKDMTWNSSDTKIATVSSNGLVTAKAAGTATITVTTHDSNHQATCTVTVNEPEPTFYDISIGTFDGGSVSANPTSAVAGETINLTIIPEEGYEPDVVSAYRTGYESTTVPLSGLGLTRTFIMPEYGVTVTATFKKTQAQLDKEAVDAAKKAIENGTYSVAQTTANTEADVKTWLAQQINALSGMSTTEITITAANITLSNFKAAVEGTADNTGGTNGGFSFSVSLKKGTGTTTASKQGTITATPYTPPATYKVTFDSSGNGKVTASKTSAPAGETITLTIIPDEGYEPDVVSAYRTGNKSTTVTLSGSGLSRTFTMPEYDVTVTATFKKTQAQLDKEALEAAKAAVEGGTYSIAQATGNTEAAVKTWLVNTLNVLFGQSHGIQFRLETSIVGDVTIISLTPAVAGTESNPKGKDGSFLFKVTMTNGGITLATNQVSGVIIATPYVEVPKKSIELTLPSDLTVHIANTGNTATGKLTLALSGANADAFSLSSTAITDLPVGKEIDITLTPRSDLARGTYTALLTVSGEGLDSKSIEIAYEVTNTNIENVPQESLKARKETGRLHISGLIAGKSWSVSDITGTLVYHSIADSNEANIRLAVRGVYIIHSGNRTIKVVY